MELAKMGVFRTFDMLRVSTTARIDDKDVLGTLYSEEKIIEMRYFKPENTVVNKVFFNTYANILPKRVLIQESCFTLMRQNGVLSFISHNHVVLFISFRDCPFPRSTHTIFNTR